MKSTFNGKRLAELKDKWDMCEALTTQEFNYMLEAFLEMGDYFHAENEHITQFYFRFQAEALQRIVDARNTAKIPKD